MMSKNNLLSLLALFLTTLGVYGQAFQKASSPFVDPQTPVNAQPLGISGDWDLEFSDEFNDSEIDSTKWTVSVSTKSRAPRAKLGVDDWWWVEQNAFLDGQGHLVLRGTKVDHNTMHCGSVESRDLYEPTYGYLEARIQVAETAKGNHTAFWLQGHNQKNVDNSGADGAEVDIFESAWVANRTKAVVHFDGYGAQKKNHTIPYDTPNLHSGFHVFGLHWTPDSMNIYYDGVKVESTNPNKPFPFTVNPNGYPLVPQVPEWLWLSVGASFGDGDFQSQSVGTLSDALVDYVRVYQVAQAVSIREETARPAIRLYPNPTQGLVHLESNHAPYQLSVFDLSGRLLRQSSHLGSRVIDLSSFAKGLYLFQIESGKGVSHHRVMVH
jgi:beta-glucanase (GH16 family)